MEMKLTFVEMGKLSYTDNCARWIKKNPINDEFVSSSIQKFNCAMFGSIERHQVVYNNYVLKLNGRKGMGLIGIYQTPEKNGFIKIERNIIDEVFETEIDFYYDFRNTETPKIKTGKLIKVDFSKA